MKPRRPPVRKINGAPLFSRKVGCAAPGFSLTEVLVVLAIAGLLLGFTIPALQSLLSAKGATAAAVTFTNLIEHARTEATTQQTYVWLGIQSTQTPNDRRLTFGLMASKDGSPDTTANNIHPITTAYQIRNVALVEMDSINVVLPYQEDQIGNVTGDTGFTFNIGQTDFSSGNTITFTPRGEILLKAQPLPMDGINSYLGIGLRQMRGSTPVEDNDIAIVVETSSGVAQTIRR